MSARRIQLYIAKEVAVPTLLGLCIFTIVLLMGRVLKLLEMVINKGVPISDILLLFAYLLPGFLVITIPLAFLLGVLLGFGRLSSESEVTALKASGISVYNMAKPVLALAILASVATASLTLYAEPAGNTAFRNQVFQIATSRASVGLQPRVFNDEFDGLVIYADGIDERSSLMQGVFISDERQGSTPSVIVAQTGRIISDQEALSLTLRLTEGSIHRRPADQKRQAYQTIDFSVYDINLNMGQELTPAKRNKKPKELTLAEVQQARQSAATPAVKHAMQVELHRRLVLPLAPLVFAFIAVPLGIQNQRSGRGGGFAVGLLVFLVFYILFSFGETLALEKQLPPLLTLWLPALIYLAGGVYLLHMTAREKGLAFFEQLWDIPRSFKRFLFHRRPR